MPQINGGSCYSYQSSLHFNINYLKVWGFILGFQYLFAITLDLTLSSGDKICTFFSISFSLRTSLDSLSLWHIIEVLVFLFLVYPRFVRNGRLPWRKRKELLWEISCGSAINSAFKEKKEKKERKMKEKNHYYLRDTKLLDF